MNKKPFFHWCYVIAGLMLLSFQLNASASTKYAPIVYRITSGERPYVKVSINQQDFLLMVHANTNFFAMITHANAARAGITDITDRGTYGITAKGKLSNLGSGRAVANDFSVAGATTKQLPIQIFEIPQDPPVDGMLGLKWLQKMNVMVDYKKDRLVIPENVKDQEDEVQQLLQEGYVRFPMTWDEKNKRYMMQAKINGVSGNFVISTVAQVTLDNAFSSRAGLDLSGVIDTYGGPTGTMGEERETKLPVQVEINGNTFNSPKAHSYDIYAYMAMPRPAKPEEEMNGYLGCDFMHANGAVIDFGSASLFLKPSHQ